MQTLTYSYTMSKPMAAALFAPQSSLFREPGERRLLTSAEAAEYLSTSQWTVRRLVYRGQLQAIRGKSWKFDRRDLDRWIEGEKR
jgi:excisionase family DNA binding protein